MKTHVHRALLVSYTSCSVYSKRVFFPFFLLVFMAARLPCTFEKQLSWLFSSRMLIRLLASPCCRCFPLSFCLLVFCRPGLFHPIAFRLSSTAGSTLLCTLLFFSCVPPYLRHVFCSVNAVVDPASVLPTALSYARAVMSSSPDSVQSTKEGLLFSQLAHIEESVQMHALSAASRRLWRSRNIKVRSCVLLPY